MKKSSLHQFLNYTLTTEMYMADVSGHAPKEALPALAEGYSKLMEKDKSIITKLKFWAEKYPSIPQFKNYISTYYSLHNDKEKAMQVNNELSEKFPDYIFAKINKANFFLFDDEEEQVPELLGENLELTELYPQRKIFHYDEYFAFYETAGMYYCQVNELDKAEAILENLFEVAELLDIDRDFEKLQNSILLNRLQNIIPDKFPGKEPVTGKEKPTLPQTKKPPVLHYPQISWLYKYSMVNMPAEKIEEILALEKEWLRIDLETVIYDAIKRFDFFKGEDLNDDENDFCLHALYLLKEIKAEESLPVVLEFFRQPQALLDFCVLDMLTENLWQVIYTLGFNQLNKLAEFLKEPLNYTFSRTTVSVALTQIVLHHTEKREEVIGVYKDVIDFFISNKNDETIIDADFIDLMIADIIDFNGTELLPGIKELFNAGIVDEFVVGSLEDVLKEFNDLQAGEDVGHKKVLQDYFEIVKDFAEWQKNNEDDDEYYGDEDDEENDEEIFNDYEEVEEDKTTQFYSDDKPYVRSVPKVGRNEPCPCGSGKKYKNCHGINE